MKNDFWNNFDPVKHAALTKAKNQTRLVYFAIAYLSLTTLALLVLLGAIAFGRAALPERVVNVLMAATIGQFAGAPVLLYRALFASKEADADEN